MNSSNIIKNKCREIKTVTCAKCLSIEQFRKERRNSKIAITQWSSTIHFLFDGLIFFQNEIVSQKEINPGFKILNTEVEL
ncbi:hypothetical protein BpHYR1_029512 [Brachionus plicatilis]|uniref:Uncharacterized protein n=1 Tax=Brachionus plicatilis TaxID=10195 RepID=A0A3M7RPB6_BRAPC|nr:hypothetical protein BpHYR1_029512 [Brachionus plicatilis]